MPNSSPHPLVVHFARSVPHCKALGQEVLHVGKGTARVRQPYDEKLLGDAERGLIHTSVQLSLVDSLFGVTVFSVLDLSESIATLDLRVDYHRPAVAGEDLIAEAVVERVTHQIVFVSGKIWQGDAANVTAVARASFMRGANARSAVGAKP